MRFIIFFGFLVLIVLVQHFWFSSAWRRIEGVTSVHARLILQILWLASALVVLANFLEPFFGRLLPRGGLGSLLIASSRVWLVASFFGFFAFQLVQGAGWISRLTAGMLSPGPADPARRDFFRYAAYMAGSLPFLAATYGFAAGRRNFTVEKVDIPIQGLPAALDGLRIVQLSDIHIGEFMPREDVARAVEMANQLRPDLAVVTGDFISGHNDPLADCIAALSKLHAPLGTWGCNGNHEIYAGAEATATDLFAAHGMRLLRQENAEIEWRGARFNLIGVDYQRDHMTPGPHGAMLQGIEPLLRRDMPNLLLSHNPNSFRRAADLGIDLSLAGHTHGGQVKFEIVDHSITPARLITDFVAGLYRLPMSNGNSGKTSYLYVNRGLGTFGVPMRIGVPPEITLLTLRSA